MKASLPEVNQFTGNCFCMVRIISKNNFLKLRHSKVLTGRLLCSPVLIFVPSLRVKLWGEWIITYLKFAILVWNLSVKALIVKCLFFFLRNCPDHRLFFVPFFRRKGKKVKAMEKQEKVNQPKTQPTTSKKATAMKRRKTERRESKTMTLTKWTCLI